MIATGFDDWLSTLSDVDERFDDVDVHEHDDTCGDDCTLPTFEDLVERAEMDRADWLADQKGLDR